LGAGRLGAMLCDCPKFAAKFHWQHSMAQPQKPPYRRKDLADISSKNRLICEEIHSSRLQMTAAYKASAEQLITERMIEELNKFHDS